MKPKPQTLRWTARLIGLLVLSLGLPFYLGYGNPLPFADAAYTGWDNFWLCILPVMFAGLALGWRWERIGGWLVTLPLGVGLLLGVMVHGELLWFLLAPLAAGVLFLMVGHKRK